MKLRTLHLPLMVIGVLAALILPTNLRAGDAEQPMENTVVFHLNMTNEGLPDWMAPHFRELASSLELSLFLGKVGTAYSRGEVDELESFPIGMTDGQIDFETDGVRKEWQVLIEDGTSLAVIRDTDPGTPGIQAGTLTLPFWKLLPCWWRIAVFHRVDAEGRGGLTDSPIFCTAADVEGEVDFEEVFPISLESMNGVYAFGIDLRENDLGTSRSGDNDSPAQVAKNLAEHFGKGLAWWVWNNEGNPDPRLLQTRSSAGSIDILEDVVEKDMRALPVMIEWDMPAGQAFYASVDEPISPKARAEERPRNTRAHTNHTSHIDGSSAAESPLISVHVAIIPSLIEESPSSPEPAEAALFVQLAAGAPTTVTFLVPRGVFRIESEAMTSTCLDGVWGNVKWVAQKVYLKDWRCMDARLETPRLTLKAPNVVCINAAIGEKPIKEGKIMGLSVWGNPNQVWPGLWDDKNPFAANMFENNGNYFESDVFPCLVWWHGGPLRLVVGEDQEHPSNSRIMHWGIVNAPIGMTTQKAELENQFPLMQRIRIPAKSAFPDRYRDASFRINHHWHDPVGTEEKYYRLKDEAFDIDLKLSPKAGSFGEEGIQLIPYDSAKRPMGGQMCQEVNIPITGIVDPITLEVLHSPSVEPEEAGQGEAGVYRYTLQLPFDRCDELDTIVRYDSGLVDEVTFSWSDEGLEAKLRGIPVAMIFDNREISLMTFVPAGDSRSRLVLVPEEQLPYARLVETDLGERGALEIQWTYQGSPYFFNSFARVGDSIPVPSAADVSYLFDRIPCQLECTAAAGGEQKATLRRMPERTTLLHGLSDLVSQLNGEPYASINISLALSPTDGESCDILSCDADGEEIEWMVPYTDLSDPDSKGEEDSDSEGDEDAYAHCVLLENGSIRLISALPYLVLSVVYAESFEARLYRIGSSEDAGIALDQAFGDLNAPPPVTTIKQADLPDMLVELTSHWNLNFDQGTREMVLEVRDGTLKMEGGFLYEGYGGMAEYGSQVMSVVNVKGELIADGIEVHVRTLDELLVLLRCIGQAPKLPDTWFWEDSFWPVSTLIAATDGKSLEVAAIARDGRCVTRVPYQEFEWIEGAGRMLPKAGVLEELARREHQRELMEE